MKILLISASPRKKVSQGFLLASEVLRGCAGEVDKAEIIHLCDYKIEFCRACERCHKEILNCPIKDDVPKILRKTLSADGIILASPDYLNQVSASMKALFDRSSHFIHCLQLEGKYIVGSVARNIVAVFLLALQSARKIRKLLVLSGRRCIQILKRKNNIPHR